MKYMLVVLITMSNPVVGEGKKIFELRIPQSSKEECDKSARTFKFYLPVISIDTRCEPKKVDEQPSMKSI